MKVVFKKCLQRFLSYVTVNKNKSVHLAEWILRMADVGCKSHLPINPLGVLPHSLGVYLFLL